MASPARRIIASPAAKVIFIIAMLMISSLTIHRWIWRHGTPPPLSELFPSGEIRIGVDASFPPFATATDSDLFGVDIDLGKALGERIGLPVRFVNMGYDGLYDSLLSGQVDIVISALLIDPQRTADVYYSWAYFNAGLVLVSDDMALDGMRALSGHSLAYEYGSSADSEARAWLRRIPPFETRPYETQIHALDAVRLGEASAALVDATTARLYLRAHLDWHADYTYVNAALYSAASRIDRKWVWRLVNREMLAMLNDGTIDTILARWL